MKTTLTVLGSSSGTEPTPGRFHTSLLVEHGAHLYWFDAGETCSYNAHILGKDISDSAAIFISHTHMDHIGGLPNLLWNIRKLTTISEATRQKMSGRELPLFIPDLNIWEAIQQFLHGTEGGFQAVFTVCPKPLRDGLIYQADGVRVTALHNLHMGGEPPFRSYSFRAEFEEKSLVYSGDVRAITDFASLIPGADLLMMETGHHDPVTVCEWLKGSGLDFGHLLFVHHGRKIIDDYDNQLRRVKEVLGARVSIAEDNMCVEL